MAGLAVHNPRLRIEALDASSWSGRWLTVLITPWCMNLVLLPAAAGPWCSARGHERLFYKFPPGDFAFLSGAEAEVGEYQSCSLFSTMGEFPDQESARATAVAVLDALLRVPPAAQPACATREPSQPSRRAFLSRGMAKG